LKELQSSVAKDERIAIRAHPMSGRIAYELRRLENVLTTVVITLESAIDWIWLGKKVLNLFLRILIVEGFWFVRKE
jgi:hypothetical protein